MRPLHSSIAILTALLIAGCSTPVPQVGATDARTDAGTLEHDAGTSDAGATEDAGNGDAGELTSDGGADAGPTGPLTYRERVDRWYEAMGDPFTRCDGVRTDPSIMIGIYKDKARGNERPNPLLRALEAGEVEVEQEKLEACFDAFANRSCSDAFNLSFEAYPECDGIFVPKRKLSETCRSPYSCELGTTCSRACGGTCVALTEDDCARNADCAEGMACWTRDSTCVPAVPPGAEGESCDPFGRCGPGLYCDLNASRRGLCSPLLPEGARCGDWLSCADGMECNNEFRCRPRRNVGDACTDKRECSWDASNLVCDINISQCQELPKTGPCLAGTVCSYYEAWCDKTMSPPTCRPLKQPNELCGSSSECAPTWSGRDVSCEPDAANVMRCLPPAPGACD